MDAVPALGAAAAVLEGVRVEAEHGMLVLDDKVRIGGVDGVGKTSVLHSGDVIGTTRVGPRSGQSNDDVIKGGRAEDPVKST